MNVNEQNLILTCIDGSSTSEAVCDYAAWISLKVAAPLKLLHTISHQNSAALADYSGAIGLGSREELLHELTIAEQNRSRLLMEKGQLMLRAAHARVSAAGVVAAEICQRHGSLVESLIDLEDRTRVLVVGIRGESHAEGQHGLGAQLESLIRASHRPILVVNTEFSTPKNVMLAYDGSEACKKALAMFSTSPLFKGMVCHVVHVGDNGHDLLNEAKAVLAAAGMETQTAELSGKIDEALSNYQLENAIDIMAMGAFSHSRIRDFLVGSFTHKMLARTNKPLLLLR